jgi:hypothetical protein
MKLNGLALENFNSSPKFLGRKVERATWHLKKPNKQ